MKARFGGSRKSRSTRIVLSLLACSLILILLPVGWSQRLNSLTQVFAPFQAAGDRVARWWNATASPDEADTNVDVSALESMIASLVEQNRSLREQNAILTAVRGTGLGPRGKLIPARLTAHDSASWRESRLLLAGRRQGIDTSSAVLSDHFRVEAATQVGLTQGMAILAAETMIGIIVDVSEFTSRVRLLSDPATRMDVSIAPSDGRESNLGDLAFWLVGLGNGKMEIRDVHHQYVTSGGIRTRDLVLTRPDDAVLPPSVTIGRIETIRRDPDNPLLFILDIDDGIEIRDVGRIYVVDTRD